MAKKIFGVYLAKLDAPDSEAHTRLELPASPWELHDAMDKVQLQENEELYLEIDDYYDFEYLAPHLDGADISLNELNDLAGQLAALDEVQGIAFEGLFSIEMQKKISTNGGIITLQDLRNLAASAKTDCYHIVDAADDTALGRFYAENDFIPELDGVPDSVFKMLDFTGIGRMMRQGENGVFVGGCYVVRDGEMTAAPPCSREFPKKPDYLFRVTLGFFKCPVCIPERRNNYHEWIYETPTYWEYLLTASSHTVNHLCRNSFRFHNWPRFFKFSNCTCSSKEPSVRANGI